MTKFIAPPAGGYKRHFLRPVVLRLTGILTSFSTLDGWLCCAVRIGRSPTPTPRARSVLLAALVTIVNLFYLFLSNSFLTLLQCLLTA